MAICAECGKEFTPEPKASLPEAFLKVTSWRKPFLGFVIAWLVGGIIGVVTAFTETEDARLRMLLLAFLVVIGVLIFEILTRVAFPSRAQRYCRDCIKRAEIARGQRPEERGPHKIAMEKEQ